MTATMAVKRTKEINVHAIELKNDIVSASTFCFREIGARKEMHAKEEFRGKNGARGNAPHGGQSNILTIKYHIKTVFARAKSV
jgi:hypothetical protein